jgi:hypothetical protein
MPPSPQDPPWLPLALREDQPTVRPSAERLAHLCDSNPQPLALAHSAPAMWPPVGSYTA